MTVRISFLPGIDCDGYQRIAIMQNVRPSIVVEAKTLDECKAAFFKAATFARSEIKPDECAAIVKMDARDKERGGTYCVAVSLTWIAPGRKPNGFNQRRWHGNVELDAPAPAIAEAIGA